MHHFSPELQALAQHHISPGGRILDLGASTTGTTQVFLQRQCSCSIEDIPELLDQLGDDDMLSAIDEHLLDKPAQVQFDLVLCWDLLSFLSPDAIKHLFERLAPHFHAGTRLHLIQPGGRALPTRPLQWRLAQDFHFDYQPSSGPEISAWRHTTVTLQRSLHPFTLVESALPSGPQALAEYVLEYDARAADKQLRHVASAPMMPVAASASAQFIALPLLQALLAELPASAQVLDCGSKHGRQLTGLHERVARLYVEDVLASMAWHQQQRQEQQGDSEHSFSEAMLNYRAGTELDAILLWDVAGYLNEQQLQQLQPLLMRILRAHGSLHLMLFNRSGLPKTPVKVEVLSDGECRLLGSPLGEAARPPLSTIRLLQQLSGFVLRRHQLGQLADGTGFHEYWFERA
ncbi:hypothetical protein GCM10011297_34460 [Bacterioplanes sanyensis]|uniref:hypothetical protein n=1 Tax=Bacterioplanes sanyensis TaxID=1249553 RepID=UPI0016741E01|nr:hypothetical protein [Bacterioplanes sanyensis]GGY58985.1 hypothetical protein GCM10011297_34460 [Bacterioplanes sanyensis]